MSQFDFIKDIAKYGLENDQQRLLQALNELVDYSKKTKKVNFALQLQSILKENLRAQRTSGLAKVGSDKFIQREEDKAVDEFILEKLTSGYSFDDLVCSAEVKEELNFFVKEHQCSEVLQKYELPIANKLLLYGPSGCGKTLASYILAGELEKIMLVINLGAIVSSKLGETSKNLAKIFRRAASEECIVFIDEFDSLGKIRDYSQDHGEMKRVVNTILQLLDFLPQESIVIAATNQAEMIDDALLRRFDVKINLGTPTLNQIQELVDKTLASIPFKFDKPKIAEEIIKNSLGLSFYSIKKTLLTAVKRSIFSNKKLSTEYLQIDTKLWRNLIIKEKESLFLFK